MLRMDFDLCYPILEKNFDNIIKKIKLVNNKKVSTYELRLDNLNCLSSAKCDISSIVDNINNLKRRFPKKKFIVTIRTKKEGGKVSFSASKYTEYICCLLKFAKVDYVDVEYKFYAKSKSIINKAINESKAKVIISKHVFDEKFSIIKCEKTFKELSKVNCDIVKLAVKVGSKEDTYKFMELSKNYSIKISKNGKRGIFIAMGKNGLVSRVFPEYTGTKVVFLNAYDKHNKLCQPNLSLFLNMHGKIFAKLN